MCVETLKKLVIFILLVFTMSIFSTSIFASQFQMEWGTVTTTGENWLQVNLENTYTTPIVVASPEYTTTTTDYGRSSWVTNVTSSSFMIRTTNAVLANSDTMKQHYIVMEQGDWTLPGSGIKIQADKLSTTKYGSNSDGWACPAEGDLVTFTNPFDASPLVISTRGTDNNPSIWGATFQTNTVSSTSTLTSTEMCIGLSRGLESATTFTIPETIYWIAADSGSGYLEDFEFEILHQTSGWMAGYDDAKPFTQPWAHSWVGTPNTIVGGMTSMVGVNGAWPIIYDIGNTAMLRMFVEESTDRAHAAEAGGAWAFDGPGFIGNSPPLNINISSNISRVIKGNSLGIDAVVTDKLGNNTVSNVTVTIQDSNATKYNITLTPELINLSLLTPDLELSTQGYTAAADSGILGETGELTLQNRESKLITFTQTYTQTPIIIATVATQNNGENAYAPIIHSINTTHANISLCRDFGATTCDTSYIAETVNYAIFDISKSNTQSWIDVGTVSASTNGASTPFTFGKTFTNVPKVFALPQTYNLGGVVANSIAAHSWINPVSTTGASIVGCAHIGIGDTCTGTANENFGYVAIDFTAVNLDKFASGEISISNSAWTTVAFGQTYTNSNVFVMVQSDNGGQDGKYPWTKSISTTGADVRYCEQDAADVCNSHTGEDTAWFALETGVIKLTGSTSDIEANGFIIPYLDLFNQTTHAINNIDVIINISIYDNSGSVTNANNNPDIRIELLNNLETWIDLGVMGVSNTGQYTINTINSGILSGWEQKNNRQIRITPINLDYSSGAVKDILEWTDLQVQINYTQYTSNWSGIFTNTNTCFTNNITDMYSVDTAGLTNHTTYTNKSFEVTCGPVITLLNPFNEEKMRTNNSLDFIFNMTTFAPNISCDFLVDGIVRQTSACFDGINIFNFEPGLGYHNWTINATDSNNFTTFALANNFLNIFKNNQKITKSISRSGVNIYESRLSAENLINSSNSVTVIDFVADGFSSGYTPAHYDFMNLSSGLYSGMLFGHDMVMASLSNVDLPVLSSGIIGLTNLGIGKVEDNFVVGLE